MKSKHNHRAFISAVSLTIVLCIAMLLMCISSFTAFGADASSLVTITQLNLRKSASSSATVLTTMPKDATVTLLENSSSGWAKVSYSSYTGYCSTTYLTLADNSSVTMSGVTTDAVNLRSGKGTSYSALTVVPSGTTVSVVDNSHEEWAKVSYSNYSGYISKEYLNIKFTLSSTASTVTEPTVQPSNNSNKDYTSIPHWYSYSLTDSLLSGNNVSSNKLMLDVCELNLDINDTYKLTPFVSDNYSVLGHVSFSSNKTSVATVSSNGTIVAKSSGSAVITATDLASNLSATCTVTVSKNTSPTQPPTSAPTQPPTSAPTTPSTIEISSTKATLYVGNQYILKTNVSSGVTWSTSKSSVATVSNGVVTAKAAGSATITATSSAGTATCTITVKAATTTVNISSSSATVTAGKTYLASSSTSSVTWSSSDTSVATVSNGYILGVSPGQAIIKVSKSGGAKTMLVTVEDTAPIRFAYTSPNCAAKNSQVTLIAITDAKRTDVKFNITVGSTTKSVTATSKTADGNNYIWKASTSFDSAGTYSVKAYSKLGGKWSTCSDGATTAFVTSTTDKTTTVCANRRASDEIINLIANYEGFISSVYSDPLTGDPTLGYGRVVYTGQQFYNNLSKTEAYAYLVQTVNNDGYTSKVNSFLVNNSVKFNQQQFDALVCFVYNTGTAVLSNDDELVSALLDCSSGSSSSTKTYYISGSAVRIRSGPTTAENNIIKELDYGTTLTIIEKTSSSWYYVKLEDGTKGYVATAYITSKTSSGSLDLNYVKKQTLINKFCQYHHANGCIYGLLYRRVDEMEVFFYNEYTRNNGNYMYDIKFTCANNKNFHT